MSVPSPEILEDIDKLITEITGFQENDENFTICQRYCLSHVIHHIYPCVNRNSVNHLVESYISRFFGHGYFKVSQELNIQVEKFLSHNKLFEKNSQYDIQWCLLNLLCLLSTNLSAVKSIPLLLPTDCQDSESDDVTWNEYLINDLKLQLSKLSSDSETESLDEEESCCEKVSTTSKEELNEGKVSKEKENQNKIINNEFTSEKASVQRKQIIKKIIDSKKSVIDYLEYDFKLRGNISEKFDKLVNSEGIYRKSQYLSEYQMMEYILHQFLTGERIFLKKGLHNPALISITQDTLSNYLASLQPYFKITRSFISFDSEIQLAKFPEKFHRKNYNPSKLPQGSLRQRIPSVLYVYSVMLKKALESFQNELLNIADNLESYTLIRMNRKLQPHFYNLTELFRVHCQATKNWKKSSNRMCSIRILSVLYHSIMEATTEPLSFLYMNLFLHCFKVYFDIIDNWVSFLHLNDPNEEFIILKSNNVKNNENFDSEFEIYPYLEEMQQEKLKKVPILDFIAEKMIHVGESLIILKRLGRYTKTSDCISKSNLFQEVIENLNKDIGNLRKFKSFSPVQEIQEKKKSIFTLSNVNLNLRHDNGGGDFFENEKKELEKENITSILSVNENKQSNEDCISFINSTIKNPYFQMAFSTMGFKNTLKKLEEAKLKSEGSLALMIVQKSGDKSSTFYPFHKLITETCQYVLSRHVFNACILVKNIILAEYYLQNHFSLLKNVFFFSESYLIQSFIINLFTQPLIWENSYSLTLHLKECLESGYKNLASAFSVSIEKDCLINNSNILNAIDAITINYEVKWPLTLIFTSDTIIKYNKIFRFALKLKWAHWLLCNLQFKFARNKLSLLRKSNTLHRLQLLKFRVLGTLNRIENYFVSHLTSYDLDFNSFNDLKDIISAHSNFIDNIYGNCLLNERVPKMGVLIQQILIPLCIDIKKLFLQDCVIMDTELSLMESTFNNCHFQLCHILTSLEV